MDKSKNMLNTSTTGKNNNGSNHVVFTNLPRSSTQRQQRQRQQQLLIPHRGFQEILLMLKQFTRAGHHARFLANDDNDNPPRDPVILAGQAILKEHLRQILESVRMHATAMVDSAGAEVAIVVLFQIMQRNANATQEGGGEGGGAAEMEAEEEEEENTTTATSMFGIICTVYGKDMALEIVNDMLNNKNMNITTALGFAITHYREGKVQPECVYYLLCKQQELMHMYRKLLETTIWGKDPSIERGLIAIFTTTLPNKEDSNNNSTTTLFQTACHRLGRNIVVEIIEDTLQQQREASYSSRSSSSLSSRSSVNTMLALVYVAEMNDTNNNNNNNNNKNHDQTQTVHVDGIYFLLRRQPDVLLRCSSSSSNNNSIITSSSNSPTSPIEAGVAAARDSGHKVADDGCTTSSKIRNKRKRTVNY